MANADRITEVYRGEAGTPRTQARARERIQWLVSNARGQVLDVGCSQGITSLLCGRAGLEVIGVDNEEDRIEYARADLEAKPPGIRARVEFRTEDATALRFPDDSFDTVIFGEVIEHLDDPEPVLSEIARVAKPDGTVIVTTPLGYSPHPDHSQTFYVSSLVETLAPHLSIDSFTVVDRYLRVLARPGPMTQEKAAAVIVGAQSQLEEAFLDLEVSLARRRAREIRKARRRERRFNKAVRRRRRLARQLRAHRRTRWARLGRTLSKVDGPRGLLALPRQVARALRKLPPPPPREPKPKLKAPKLRRLLVTADSVAGTDRDLRVDVPPATPFPAGPIARPGLRVATILDPFSAAAFRYEWNQVETGPEDWLDVLERELPDLLFVESAWRGNGGRWAQALIGAGPFVREFTELVAWCRARDIPTVFWSKEDPPHFNRFLASARLFDYVFTTDSQRIGAYQEALQHERAAVLMFGVQPRIHNPVAPPGGRRHSVGFAGTYIGHKHPGRRQQMETILDPARDFDLHIYSRVPPGERTNFDWPDKYLSHIVGTLPYERMITVFKSYRLFLNVNTVVDSPTMCARRAFEISATSTPVLSGESRALREVFGDLIAVATDAAETGEQLQTLLGDTELPDRRGHDAFRHVMREHTYGHRVDAVLRAIGLEEHVRELQPTISVALPVDENDTDDAGRILRQLAAQTRSPAELVLAPLSAVEVEPLTVAARTSGIERVEVLPPASDRPGALEAAAERATGELFGALDPACGYGEHFLEDLAYVFSYTDAATVGKPLSDAARHSYTEALAPGSTLTRTEAVNRSGLRSYAADPYSFQPEAAALGEPVATGPN